MQPNLHTCSIPGGIQTLILAFERGGKKTRRRPDHQGGPRLLLQWIKNPRNQEHGAPSGILTVVPRDGRGKKTRRRPDHQGGPRLLLQLGIQNQLFTQEFSPIPGVHEPQSHSPLNVVWNLPVLQQCHGVVHTATEGPLCGPCSADNVSHLQNTSINNDWICTRPNCTQYYNHATLVYKKSDFVHSRVFPGRQDAPTAVIDHPIVVPTKWSLRRVCFWFFKDHAVWKENYV